MILLDTCTFSCVFRKDSQNHYEFKPVLDYLNSKKGKIAYGGTKYKKELRNASRYLKFIVNLERAAKVVRCDDVEVDQMMKWVSEQETDPDFDDPHLIAITIVSKLSVICTSDKRAFRFIKKKALYPKRFTRPRIYSGAKNKDLLL